MEGRKVAVHGLIGRPVAGSWQITIWVPEPMAGSFVLYAGPLPANTCGPLLPVEATSAFNVAVTCLWTVAFHASLVGKRWGVGLIHGGAAFCGPRNGGVPAAGIAIGVRR